MERGGGGGGGGGGGEGGGGGGGGGRTKSSRDCSHYFVVIFSDFVLSVLSKGTMIVTKLMLLGYKYVLSPT